MEKILEEIILCNLEVVCMPNREIIFLGKTLGMFNEFKEKLEIKKQ